MAVDLATPRCGVSPMLACGRGPRKAKTDAGAAEPQPEASPGTVGPAGPGAPASRRLGCIASHRRRRPMASPIASDDERRDARRVERVGEVRRRPARPAASEATIVPDRARGAEDALRGRARAGGRRPRHEQEQRRRRERERRALDDAQRGHEPDLGHDRVQQAADADAGHADDEREEAALAVDEPAEPRRQHEDRQGEREERQPDQADAGAELGEVQAPDHLVGAARRRSCRR